MKVRIDHTPASEVEQGRGDPNYAGHPTNDVCEVYEVLPDGKTRHLGTVIPSHPTLEVPGTGGKIVSFQDHSSEFDL